MERLLKKVTNIAVICMAALALVAAFGMLFVDEKANPGNFSIFLDISFYLTYAMIFIVMLAMVGFTIFQISSDKKQIVNTLILTGIAVVVILVAFVLAPTELSEVAQRVGITEGVYKWAGVLMNMAYIVFGGVIVAMLGTFVYIKLKK